MALFGTKKNTDEPKKTDDAVVAKDAPKKEVVKKEEVKAAPLVVPNRDPGEIIKRPIISEKATTLAEKNVYAFEVATSATKPEVVKSVKDLYKVTPVKVRIVRHQPQRFFSRMRGRKGMKSGYKKAYVYLKEGDRIEIV